MNDKIDEMMKRYKEEMERIRDNERI